MVAGVTVLLTHTHHPSTYASVSPSGVATHSVTHRVQCACLITTFSMLSKDTFQVLNSENTVAAAKHWMQLVASCNCQAVLVNC